MTREEKRLRQALEECDQLIEAALHDLLLMRVGCECIRGEVRDALRDPALDGDAAPVSIGFLVRQRDSGAF